MMRTEYPELGIVKVKYPWYIYCSFVPDTKKIMLERELKYFHEHKTELLAQYRNKYIVIVGDKVIGSYDSENEAFISASKHHNTGTFLIKLCSEKTDSYTQTFHSRVTF